MNMIFYKIFTDWNGIFEALPDEGSGKLIKAIAFFTDDLKKNQTLDLDPEARANEAIEKANITDAILTSVAVMCCSRLYSEYVASMKKSEQNKTNGGIGGTNKHRNELFSALWDIYPKKVGEDDALKAFYAVDPDDETFNQMVEGVDRWKKSAQWQDAQFIPDLAKWLEKSRWKDDPPKPAKKKNPALAYEQNPISEADFNAGVVNLDDYSDDKS